jgi:hypothetical protein
MEGVMNEVAKEPYAVLEQVLYAWAHRNEFRAAKDSASLGFWRDGMLVQLKLIASGDRSTTTFKELEGRFNESKEPVSHLIQGLKRIRGELGRGTIANQIDIILNDDEYGKNKIRYDIDIILNSYRSTHKSIAKRVVQFVSDHLLSRAEVGNHVSAESFEETWQGIKDRTQAVCKSIEILNYEIGRLHRLVYPE